MSECGWIGQLPDSRKLVREITLRSSEPLCAVHYSLGSAGGHGLGQGVTRDSEPCGLCRRKDALRGGELVESCYVIRIGHVAFVRFKQTYATASKVEVVTMLSKGCD